MSSPLNNIRIASPCSADWDKMAGDDKVRYCRQCRLNVYNLSAMSVQEAADLVARREGRFCARFYQRRDGTVLTKDCPVGLKIVMRKLARVAGIAFTALVNVAPAAAQNLQDAQAQTAQSQSGLDLLVVDQTGAVCYGAKVELVRKGESGQTLWSTDQKGELHIGHLSPGTYMLKVREQNFKPYETTIVLRGGVRSAIEVTLQISAALQGEIVTVPEDPITVIQSETPLLTPVPVPAPKPARPGFLHRLGRLLHVRG